MAYEADLAGTSSEILVQEGETVAIGTPIARVGDTAEGSDRSTAGQSAQPAGPVAAGDPPPPPVAKASSGGAPPTAPPAEAADESRAEAQTAEADAPAESPTEKPEQSAAGDGHRPKASPLARRMAKDAGLDLQQLQGSGPGGRIVKADVERASSAAGPADGAAGLAVPSPETAKGEVTYQEPSKTQSLIARRMAESKATAPHFYLAAEVDMSRAVAGRA